MCRPHAFWAVALFGTLASCGGVVEPQAPSAVRITTAKPTYGPGDTVVVTLENISQDRVLYNACSAFLERWQILGWGEVMWAAGDQPCNDNVDALEAGATVGTWFPIPSTLAPGMYRYRFTGITNTDARLLPERERLSNTFSIQ